MRWKTRAAAASRMKAGCDWYTTLCDSFDKDARLLICSLSMSLSDSHANAHNVDGAMAEKMQKDRGRGTCGCLIMLDLGWVFSVTRHDGRTTGDYFHF